MTPPRRPKGSLAWGSSRASSALASSAAGWMLSGISASPLINGLLPALVTAGGLVARPGRGRLGAGLQLAALLLLLIVALLQRQHAGGLLFPDALAGLTLAAATLRAMGDRMSLLSLQQRLWHEQGMPPAVLRNGREIGQLLGHLLTGVLFPLGRALLQFVVALLLLLPSLRWLGNRGAALAAPAPARRSSAALAELADGGAETAARRCMGQALAQGLLFGALFALLPLWVRQLEQGSCFDFGMVLAVYGLGRCLAPLLATRFQRIRICGGVANRMPHMAMGLLLLASAFLPGWAAVLLFLPLGLLAGLSDQGLLNQMALDAGPVPQAWERSMGLGGLLGSLGMGSLTQLIGLAWALPLLVMAFLLAALLLPVWRPLESAP